MNFTRYAQDLYLKKVSGASAGAIAAAYLLCDAPLGGSFYIAMLANQPIFNIVP